jgi:CheY-like chemotaxis protein
MSSWLSEPAKVLVVEDDPGLQEVIVSHLREAQFGVITAGTGDEALAYLKGGEPLDVLFTDIRTPGEADGWEVARRFRERYPELPVLYATGFEETLHPVPGGVLIPKPYRGSQVIWAIEGLITDSLDRITGPAPAA